MRNQSKRKNRRRVLKKLLKGKLAVLGMIVCVLIILCAIFGPLISSYDPYATDATSILKAPSEKHLLGTDELGRDVLCRMFYGARITVIVGVVAVFIAMVLGTTLGMISGYFGGKIDTIISGIMDGLWSFPTIILALTITAALGAGLYQILIAIGVVFTPSFSRVVRSMVISVREMEYVDSARAIGLSDFEIIMRYILPNISSVIIVQASLNAGQAILSEASLSFMGLGITMPDASWGALLQSGYRYITIAPWLSVFPGVAIFLIVIGLSFLGDGLRDALDVRIISE